MSVPVTTLGQVLDAVHALPWDQALYLPLDESWSLQTRCMVLDPNDCEDAEETPEAAKVERLEYALDIQSVRGVVDNAREQRPAVTLDELLRAFLYYYDHDAFMTL